MLIVWTFYTHITPNTPITKNNTKHAEMVSDLFNHIFMPKKQPTKKLQHNTKKSKNKNTCNMSKNYVKMCNSTV